MKKKIPTFLAGVLTTAILGSLAVSALAASGALTISVDPINIQVNGATFAPKDAQGASVPVFAYNGTTYAPLRALAEAYGLEVGYDAGSNMATVGAKASDPATTPAPDTTVSADYSDWTAEEEAAYQEFKGMWEVNFTHSGGGEGKYPEFDNYEAVYHGSMKSKDIRNKFDPIFSVGSKYLLRFKKEMIGVNNTVQIEFGEINAGTTLAIRVV